MKALTQAAQLLRDTADQLDQLAKPLPIPPQVFNLADAFARLREVNPKGYVSIDPPAFDSHAVGKIEVAKWRVYDGKNHFSGATLDAAVAACELAHRRLPENAVEETVDIITAQPATF